MTNNTLPDRTDVVPSHARTTTADFDELFAASEHEHAAAGDHATCGLSANDEMVYVPVLDALFAAEATLTHGHAENHATCGLSASDETVYLSDLDALFADAAPAHGEAECHVTCGLSANDETVYVPVS